jgi:hypothetical protein
MTTKAGSAKRDCGEDALRIATNPGVPPGENPHTLHAEPGVSGGAPHRPRRTRREMPRSEGAQARLSRLYARQLAMRLLKTHPPQREGAKH